MSDELFAQFEKRFPSGSKVEATLCQPARGDSLTVLFGPSGCGKTTILRCLAGLDRPQQGEMRFGEQVWFDHRRRLSLSPQQRKVGYLFQDHALFPHLNVRDNIGFGLRALAAEQCHQRIHQLLELLELGGLSARYPSQISGGQRQRVALARTLACRPRLYLLDEPLTALDTALRERIRRQLRQWLREAGSPAIVVTHDRTEAISLADQIMILHEGTILQSGSPHEVFSRPVDRTVAAMVGVETVLPATVVSIEAGLARIDIQGRELLAVASERSAPQVYACIRAEDVAIQKGEPGTTSPRNRLEATVLAISQEGPLMRVALDCGFALNALVTRSACQELGLAEGDGVRAMIKVPAIHLLPR